MNTEKQKCSEDILYFKEKYLGLPKDEIQDEILRLLLNNKRLNITTGRQSKKTSSALIYILHNFLFEEEFDAGILSNSLLSSTSILSLLKQMIVNLPTELKPDIKVTKTTIINKDNKSKVLVDSLDNSSFIGLNLDFILLDNSSYIQKQKLNLFFEYIIKTFNYSQILVNDDINIESFSNNFKVWEGAFIKEEPRKVQMPIKNAGFKQLIKNIIEKLYSIIKR
jgi:hypothetical protein